MAAPPERTIKDLNGKWTMNKKLSDDFDSILKMQGVSWVTRKAIQYATITLTISEYITPADSLTHIDISQVATGGLGGTTERRTLDWTQREHYDKIFGVCKGKSRWIKLGDLDAPLDGEEELEEVDREWFKKGWLEESGGDFVLSWVVNDERGWRAVQVWGFEMIEGVRYYTRHVVVRKGDDWKQARLVYDYRPDAAEEDDSGLAY